jgi:hypothetical protein
LRENGQGSLLLTQCECGKRRSKICCGFVF